MATGRGYQRNNPSPSPATSHAIGGFTTPPAHRQPMTPPADPLWTSDPWNQYASPASKPSVYRPPAPGSAYGQAHAGYVSPHAHGQTSAPGHHAHAHVGNVSPPGDHVQAGQASPTTVWQCDGCGKKNWGGVNRCIECDAPPNTLGRSPPPVPMVMCTVCKVALHRPNYRWCFSCNNNRKAHFDSIATGVVPPALQVRQSPAPMPVAAGASHIVMPPIRVASTTPAPAPTPAPTMSMPQLASPGPTIGAISPEQFYANDQERKWQLSLAYGAGYYGVERHVEQKFDYVDFEPCHGADLQVQWRHVCEYLARAKTLARTVTSHVEFFDKKKNSLASSIQVALSAREELLPLIKQAQKPVAKVGGPKHNVIEQDLKSFIVKHQLSKKVLKHLASVLAIIKYNDEAGLSDDDSMSEDEEESDVDCDEVAEFCASVVPMSNGSPNKRSHQSVEFDEDVEIVPCQTPPPFSAVPVVTIDVPPTHVEAQAAADTPCVSPWSGVPRLRKKTGLPITKSSAKSAASILVKTSAVKQTIVKTRVDTSAAADESDSVFSNDGRLVEEDVIPCVAAGSSPCEQYDDDAEV